MIPLSFINKNASSGTENGFLLNDKGDARLQQLEYDILYHAAVFLIGGIVRHGINVLDIPLPYTVIVFIVGMVWGSLPFKPLTQAEQIQPHILLLIFLPILIFDGAFAIDTYIFYKIIIQVILLAFPAMLLMTFLLAGTAKYVFKYESWDWQIALLFGAVLSATDPVAVVAIMKELGAGKRLALLIEGESMMNDGSAIVMFQLLIQMIAEEKVMPWYQVINKFVWVAGGGPLIGYLVAHFDIFLLQWTFNDSLSEIAITITSAYILYIIAEEYLCVSAVLAVVMLGVTLSNNKTCISPEVETCLHCFWETLAFMANTSIFTICGSTVTRHVLFSAASEDYIYTVFLYIAVLVIRGIAILVFAPILKRTGYGLSWKNGLVCTWSGLRGAVGLALALMIFMSNDKNLSKPSVKEKILFHTAAIVVSTLVINATTTGWLLRFLGHTEITPARRAAMKKAISILTESRRKTMSVWKIDRFLTDADWDMVIINSTIDDPFMSTETEADLEMLDRQGGMCPDCGTRVPYVPTTSEVRGMRAEAVRKYLKLLKQNLWIQFEHGLLSGYSARKLNELAEEAADEDLKMINIYEIKSISKIPRCLASIKHFILKQTVNFASDESRSLMRGRRKFTNMVMLTSQSVMIPLGVFGIDSLLLALSLVLDKLLHESYKKLFIWSNLLMLIIMSIFLIYRIFTFRKRYVYTIWFIINVASLMFGIMEFVMEQVHKSHDDKDKVGHLSIATKTSSYLSLLRLLQLIEPAVHLIVYAINNHIRLHLTIACDMARGFVRATELSMPLIMHISDNIEIQSEIMRQAQNGKLEVLRELGLLQGIHPDIALEVKTCQAIRSVLNVMRDGVRVLMEEGGIDEAEGLLFVKVIESKMKWLKSNPPKLSIPSSRRILAAIPWIDKNMDVVNYFQQTGQKLIFQYNERIVNYNDPPNGIHVIISGLVRVVSPNAPGERSSMQTLDYLSTGNVVGEISELTKRPRMASLICETTVKTLYMSPDSLEEMCDHFSYLDPPLKSRLWQVCAMRVAANVLSKISIYQGIPKEMLLSRLEGLQVKHVDTPYVDITREMVDVVLITGNAVEPQTGDAYRAPCYIPSRVRTIYFKALDEDPSSSNPTMCFTEGDSIARMPQVNVIDTSPMQNVSPRLTEHSASPAQRGRSMDNVDGLRFIRHNKQR